MDMIGNLPSEVICHIGSFLSAKEAAFASVLSKRWRNLFTVVPKLHFDGGSVSDGRRSLEEFVDSVLALPIGSRVRKLSLKRNHYSAQSDEQIINRCLRDVANRGVLVLKLEIKGMVGGDYYPPLPFEVFTCKTVAKMKLSGFDIDLLIIPEDALLPSLKTLFLDSIRFFGGFGGRCAFQALLSASPVLEELVMDGINWESWEWSCTVSSPTLQRLTIRRDEWQKSYDYAFDSISFDTPGLTYLDYTDYVPKEYPNVNLSSLVEAQLGLRVGEFHLWLDVSVDDFDPMNLINAIKNVEVLGLSCDTTDMFYVLSEAIPVFEKLVELRVSISDESCWFSLPILIKKSPNLKRLTIGDSLHYGEQEDGYLCECMSEYSFLLPCPLEVLQVNDYHGSIEELTQMKHFLEKLPSLELVEVYAQVSADKGQQVMADLLMLPKASPKCKIQVQFL